MGRIQRVLSFCFLLLPAFSLCAAQVTPNADTARGSSPYASYEGGNIDSVNPISGNVFLHIPLLSYPQRGHALRLSFNIYYNAKQWFIYNYRGYPDGATNPQQYQGTWSYFNGTSPATTPPSGVGVYVARDQHVEFGEDHFHNAQITGNGYAGTTITTDTYGYWVREPDGAQHYYADAANQTCAVVNSGACGFSNASYNSAYSASDGSGFINNTPSLNQTSTRDRDGNTYTIPSNTGPTSNYEVITDPAGNTISVSASGWTDTTGRIIPGSYSGPGTSDGVDSSSNYSSGAFDPIPGVVSSVPTQCLGANAARKWILPELAVTTEPYYLCYTNVSYQTAFNIDPLTGSSLYGLVQEASGTTPNLLTAIVLPNGTAYHFTYDSYLSLTSVTLPTGGSISYTWQNLPTAGQTGGLGSLPVTRALKTRTLSPGNGEASSTWTYHRYYTTASGFGNASNWTIVTDPLGNDVEHHVQTGGDFSGNPAPGPEDMRTVYAGCSPHDTAADKTCSGTGTVLETDAYTLATYGGVTDGGGPWQPLNLTRRTATTTTVFSSSGSLTSEVDTTYVPNYGSCLLSSFNGTNTADTVTFTPCFTTGQVASVASYDFGAPGSGAAGTLLNTKTTNYLWQSSPSYLSSNLLDLVSSAVITDSGGKKASETDYGYDENNGSPQGQIGNQTSVTSWLNGGTSPESQAVYNSQGEPTKTLDAKLNTTQVSYQCSGSLPKQVTNALNQNTTYVYDCGTGVLDSVTDTNSNTTTYTHNDTLNRLTNIAYPDGGNVSINFNGDPTPPKVTTTTATGESAGNIVSTTLYDGLGRQTETQLTSDPEGTDYVDTTYDALGRVQSVSNPYRTTKDGTYGITSYSYDALGRKTYQCKPNNVPATATTCSPSTNYEKWSYAGNAVTFTDGNGNTSTGTSDALGRLTQMLEPNAGNSPSVATTYQYDALGNLLQVDQWGGAAGTPSASCASVTAPDRCRHFAYDSLSRLTAATNPEIGGIFYSYTTSGNGLCSGDPSAVCSRRDARGITTTYTYADALNRLTGKAYSYDPTNTPAVSYVYDVAAPHWTFIAQTAPNYNLAQSNLIGRLSYETNSNSATVYGYDAMGRPNLKSVCTPLTCGSYPNAAPTDHYDMNRSYDLAGLVSYTSNGMAAVENAAFPNTGYFYGGFGMSNSAAGKLIGVTANLTDGTHPATMLGAMTYSPLGGISYLQLGNYFDQAFGYNPLGSKTAMTARNGPRTNLRSIQYSTDNLGIVRGISDSVLFGSYNYTYDRLSRLTGGTGTNYSGGGYGYTYDAWGNTLTHSPAGGLTIPASTPDQNNRLTSIFQYDPSGNITLPATNSNGIPTPLTHSYSSDAENRIYVVDGTTQYLYDPEGRRVATKASGSVTNEYLYDFDGNLVTTLGTNKKMQRGFVYAGGQHWADYNGTTNKTEFQFSDTTGTFTTKYDQSGNALEVCYSGPFGEGLSCSGSTDYSELHFANKKRDSESGNDYFGARYYSSMMGRFMSPDWSATVEPVPYAKLGNPQSLNLYTYVENSPLSRVDNDGHDWVYNWLTYNTAATQNSAFLSSQLERHQAQQQNGEGSSSNVDKRNALADAAYGEAKGKSTAWAQGNGAPKCNVFVCAMLNKAGIGGPTYPGGDNPLVAQDWANPKFKVDNWRVLGPGEAPAAGDVAAYKESFSNATGHSGIVTGNENGTIRVVAAGSTSIYQTTAGSKYFGQGMVITYRRYTGP